MHEGCLFGPSLSTDDIINKLADYHPVYKLFPNRTCWIHKLPNCWKMEWWWVGSRDGWNLVHVLWATAVFLPIQETRRCKRNWIWKIKFREGFRPFVLPLLQKKQKTTSILKQIHLICCWCNRWKQSLRNPVPGNYHQLSLNEKLYFQRSGLPAITHIDYSARIQTVHAETNKAFHDLLLSFEEQTRNLCFFSEYQL